MTEPQPPNANTIDQQRRVITATRTDTRSLMDLLGELADHMQNYMWLGLGDDQILLDESFSGTGTDRTAYRAAITSLTAIQDLMAQGHGTNLARFSV